MTLQAFDSAVAAALRAERQRQEGFVELIASENYASPRVLEVQGSCLTNKYADGYPGARTYSGCEHVDVVENLARERACQLFGADFANVQPYSGTQANAAVYAALLEPGDTLLGMAAAHGGHITHGDASSFAGRIYRAVAYGTSPSSARIDYDEIAALSEQHRPKLIVAGYSAYSRTLDWARFREIADAVGAYLLVDMAHAAGLIAAGFSPNPVPFADVCTSTTHKTLRGPRGGLILGRGNAEIAHRLDAGIYPGTQGGPLMHVVAAKAVAFGEALRPSFKAYQAKVIANAQTLAAALAAKGFDIVTGGTDNHMMLVDLSNRNISARDAVTALENAHIAVSGWRLPGGLKNEPARALRLGTAAVSTRGFGHREMTELASDISQVLADPRGSIVQVRQRVAAMCSAFPVYGPGSSWEH